MATLKVAGLRLAQTQPVRLRQHHRFARTVSGRTLLDQSGDPWLGVGDAPWALVGQLTDAQITTYLETRAAQGINLVMFSAPEWYFADNAPNNIDGVAAFTGTPFASSLNNTYWVRVDHALDECERLGITALVCPAYLGFGADGVKATIVARTNQNMTDYGTALASRYTGRPNLMWLAGHDTVPTATERERWDALADGLGSEHMIVPGGWHDNNTVSQGTTDWNTTAGSSIVFDIETVYAYRNQSVEDGWSGWNNGTLPVLHMEGDYENETNGSTSAATDLNLLRYQAWGAIVGGCFGHIAGNHPVWHFGNLGGDWTTNLDSTLFNDLTHLADFLRPRWALASAAVPDTTGTFLTAGANATTDRAGARFSTAVGLVYMPTTRAVTLDLTELTGSSFTVTRLDPTNGDTSTLTTTASGSHVVSSQGTNAGGDSDWVLWVEVT